MTCSADPLFAGPWTAPPATNLALTQGSPAIGAGATLAAVPDDFLGAPRPNGGGYDLGAFQYGAAAPSDGGVAVGPTPDGGMADAGMAGGDAGGAGGEGPGTSPGKAAGCSCIAAGDGAGRPDAAQLACLLALALASKRRAIRARRS